MPETKPVVAVVSIWGLMMSWYTPTVLFCVVNLMIVTIFILKPHNNNNRSESLDHHQDYEQQQQQQQQQNGDEQHLLRRAPSLLLQRVKSINFSLQMIRSSQNNNNNNNNNPFNSYDETQSVTDPIDHDSDPNVIRSKSDTTSFGDAPVKIPSKMKKWASEKSLFLGFDEVEEEEEEKKEKDVERRRPATAREMKGNGIEMVPFGAEEGVDEKADDFITKFRQQLKLQRVDSLLRFSDMLKRGT